MTAIRLAALRLGAVEQVAVEELWAAQAAMVGGAQSRSLVGTYQGKSALRRKAV